MATWWLALGPAGAFTSYDEIKTRRVVAQGYRRVGDLTRFLPLVMAGHQQPFEQEITNLGAIAFPGEPPPPPMLNLWKLLRIRKGDLIVGRVGAEVVGICQATQNGWHSYRYDPAYEYAQTISYPVNWVDWMNLGAGDPPIGPGIVAGVLNLVEARERVTDAWVNYIRRQAENDPLDADDDPVP